MSVTSVTPSSAGASGSASGTDAASVTVSYSSTYNVVCSDQSDTIDTVLAYFRQNADLPWAGRPFKFGNGFDANVACDNVTADHTDKSAGKFIARCTFKSQNGNDQGQNTQGRDSNGKTTDDPLRWYPQISISYSNITEAADKAIFRGFVNAGDNPLMAKDKERAITNSAGMAYDPPLERENSIQVIRIARNYKEWPGPDFLGKRNTVNNDSFTIAIPEFGYRREVRPYYAKFIDFTEENQIENGKKFWRGTTEVQIHPRTWRRQILDQGTYRSQNSATGDLTDGGTSISASDEVAGYVPFVAVKGPDGLPITHPVPFDGKGQPLAAGKPHVFLVYSIEDEVPFAGIKW
jgi:hypothetical protein